MYCKKCGNPIDSNANYCPCCGEPQYAYSNRQEDNQTNYRPHSGPQKSVTDSYNTLCIAGFVVAMISVKFAFFGIVGIVGVVLSAVGLSQIKKNYEQGKLFGILGIIIGAITTIIRIAIIIYFILCAKDFLSAGSISDFGGLIGDGFKF